MPLSPEISHSSWRLWSASNSTTSNRTSTASIRDAHSSYLGRLFKLYRHDSETVFRTAVCNKYFDRSALQYKAIHRSQVKHALKQKLQQLSLQLSASKDRDFLRETIELSLCAIYGHAKDQCCENLEKLGYTEIPRSYLCEIGLAAKKTGLPGNEKQGIFIPKGAGANPFSNRIMAGVRSEFAWHFKNKKQGQDYADYLRVNLIQVIEPFAKQAGWCSLTLFAATLADIALQYEYDPTGENAVAV